MVCQSNQEVLANEAVKAHQNDAFFQTFQKASAMLAAGGDADAGGGGNDAAAASEAAGAVGAGDAGPGGRGGSGNGGVSRSEAQSEAQSLRSAPRVISGPSDPFCVQVYHWASVARSRVVAHVTVRNMTAIDLQGLRLWVSIAGQLEFPDFAPQVGCGLIDATLLVPPPSHPKPPHHPFPLDSHIFCLELDDAHDPFPGARRGRRV